MKENLKVFGSLLGTAIVFPSSIFLLSISLMASQFKKSEEIATVTILASITSLITFMCPVLTGINFVKPNSEISKFSSILILIGGLISFLSVIFYISEKEINSIITINLIASLLIFVSGYLQFQDSK